VPHRGWRDPESLRIGAVGLGLLGSTHLQRLADIPKGQAVAVADKSERRLGGDLSDIEGNLGIHGSRTGSWDPVLF